MRRSKRSWHVSRLKMRQPKMRWKKFSRLWRSWLSIMTRSHRKWRTRPGPMSSWQMSWPRKRLEHLCLGGGTFLAAIPVLISMFVDRLYIERQLAEWFFSVRLRYLLWNPLVIEIFYVSDFCPLVLDLHSTTICIQKIHNVSRDALWHLRECRLWIQENPS